MVFLLVCIFIILNACQQRGSTSNGKSADKIVIGSVGSDAEIWKFIANSAFAKQEGLTIEVQEIEGGPQLNKATVEGVVNVNAFQTLGYLISFNQDSKEKLAPISTTYMEPMGIYSSKYKSLSEIPQGAVVALADNPANTARALRLLEDAGLVRLAADFDNGTGTPKDIVENPQKLQIKLIDDTTGPRILPDVDLVIIGNTIAFEAGLNVLTDSLYKEEINPNTVASINVLATVKGKEKSPNLKKLEKLYHRPEVKKYIQEHLGDTKVDVQEDIDQLWEALQ